MQRLEVALDSERLRAKDLDETLREAITMFVDHADAEIEAIRSESSQLDRAILTVQSSWFWRSKLRLGKVVPAIRSALRPRKG